MARRLRPWLAILLAIAGCLALPSLAAAQPPFAPGTPLFSDFDGDSKVDQAELFSNGVQKHIHVSLGSLNWTFLSFNSGVQDRGRLLSDDIDRDGDTDIVWVSQNLPRTYVTWLGDGRGNFSLAAEDEQDHFQTSVGAGAQTHVGGDSDDGEPDGVLQTASVAVESVPSASDEIPSKPRARLTQPVVYSSICLTALWKRGPPSQLS